MSPTEHQKFTRYTPFALMGLIALLGGVFITVLSSQQQQDQRSKASTTYTTNTLQPIEDAVVYQSSSSNNWGTKSVLETDTESGRNQYSYLKFDLRPHAGKTITGAKLRLRTNSDSDSGSNDTVAINLVSDTAWSETGITYNNRPSFSTNLGSMRPSSPGRLYETTLTASQLQYAVGGLLSLGLMNPGSDQASFDSRETSYDPELILTFSSTSYPASSTPAYYPPTATPAYGTQPPSYTTEAISLVQSKLYYNYNTNSGGATLPQSVAAGNLLVVAVSNFRGAVSVTDNVGNSYRQAAVIPSSGTGAGQINIFYAENTKPGTTTITAKSSASSYTTSVSIAAYEYKGLAKVNAFDRAATATGTSSTINTGTTQGTSQNNELVFAAGTFDSDSKPGVTPASGFTIRHVQVDNTRSYAPLMTQDRIVTTTGAYSAPFKLSYFSCGSTYGGSSSCSTKGAIATFKAEIVYPTPTPTTYYPPTPTPTTYYPPTPTPTTYYPPTPTQVVYYPPTATPTPYYAPTATLAPYGPTLTPTPYYAPTAAPTATPYPTYTPMPTPTIQPYATTLAFTLALHGIGNGGDNVNPNSKGNTSPLRPQRTVTVDVHDAANTLVKSQVGSVQYDEASGLFKGVISLGTAITSGSYQIKVKTDQFLRNVVPGIQTLTAGQTYNVPQTALITGDINNDNQVNILDYNILMGCYSDLSAPVNCAPGDEKKADITDDGKVNQFDYNLFLRELTNRGGQ